jgi:hypothetical protein
LNIADKGIYDADCAAGVAPMKSRIRALFITI